MSPDTVNVYKAISELQTVLVGLIDEARQESRQDHHTLMHRIDGMDERLRHLEKKAEPTPWPPMQRSQIVLTDVDADNKPILSLPTFAQVKRWGWAFAAFGALITGFNLATEFILKFLHWLGFHR